MGFLIRSNNKLLIQLISLFTFNLYSCCTDMYCYNADDIGEIMFLNFSKTELDSAILIFYKKDTDYKEVESSQMIIISESYDTTTYYGFTQEKISVNFDYQVYLPNITKKYNISGFRIVKAECNVNCFPKDYYYKVEDYEVNGKYKASSSLQIDQLTD